jgi:hypothetical protein
MSWKPVVDRSPEEKRQIVQEGGLADLVLSPLIFAVRLGKVHREDRET